MSTTTSMRKRARKACIPCHQRKRKCDAEYPCGMCTTYEYNCRYADDTTGTASDGVHAPPRKRRSFFGGYRMMGPDVDDTTDTPGGDVHSSPPRDMGASLGGIRMMGRAAASTSPSPASPSQRYREANGASAGSTTSSGIFDEHKSRYAGASAAMAFPHVLGVNLGSDSPPKIRSFAYNFGIRPEEPSYTHGLLDNFISEYDLRTFSGIFFSAMAPIADYMDPRIYAQRCRGYYHSPRSTSITFTAVAAGVAALGSFLSPDRYPRESELVQYAKAILDDPASMRVLGVDHVIAWAMRTFYLRATTRPNNAWIASCTGMHLCEAVGLHEEETIKKMASVAGAAVVGHDADRLRRIFWISWAGHNLLSYEFDRWPVQFRAVSCQDIIPTPGSVADQFVRIAQIIPAPNSPFHLECHPSTPREELFERLKALDKVQVVHPFLVVTKADLAFCFYRRIYQLKMGISDEILKLVIDSGNAAVQAAEQLASEGHLFWNVIGSVFHYTCVLLAIDTPASSVHIAAAFRGLENLVQAADTGLTREALSIARHLLSLNVARKRKELAQLEAVDGSCQSFQAHQESETNTALPNVDWGLDWDQFLFEPYISMLSPNL
ncbi:hypothetical protein V502_05820 [Pseudogymnoascus sp. VKM F-4520 (FW-2644)]|nr:hypothetical protein V502_05820 [Pseudogymnoascus sp. VKM F-4520 (FW-2644)]